MHSLEDLRNWFKEEYAVVIQETGIDHSPTTKLHNEYTIWMRKEHALLALVVKKLLFLLQSKRCMLESLKPAFFDCN